MRIKLVRFDFHSYGFSNLLFASFISLKVRIELEYSKTDIHMADAQLAYLIVTSAANHVQSLTARIIQFYCRCA